MPEGAVCPTWCHHGVTRGCHPVTSDPYTRAVLAASALFRRQCPKNLRTEWRVWAGPGDALRDALAPHKDQLLDRLWAAVEQPARGQEAQRLRAACALATYDTDSPRWGKSSGKVVEADETYFGTESGKSSKSLRSTFKPEKRATGGQAMKQIKSADLDPKQLFPERKKNPPSTTGSAD